MEAVMLGAAVVFGGLVMAIIAVVWIARAPGAYGQFQDVIESMSHENQVLREELAATDRAIRDVRRELQQAERRIGELEQFAEDATAHNELLATRLRALGQLDIPPAPTLPARPHPAPAAPPVQWADVTRRLAEQFSLDELDNLAMELALLEVVAGDSQEARAASLVKAAARRKVLEKLREIARRERPRGGF